MLTCSYHVFPIWRCYDSGMTWDDDPWDQHFFHVHQVRLKLLTMATLRLNKFFRLAYSSIYYQSLINQQSGWFMRIALIKPFGDHFSHEPSLSSFQKKTEKQWGHDRIHPEPARWIQLQCSSTTFVASTPNHGMPWGALRASFSSSLRPMPSASKNNWCSQKEW